MEAITASATSCASTARLGGVANAALAIISSVRPGTKPVWTSPGATMTTRISGPSTSEGHAHRVECRLRGAVDDAAAGAVLRRTRRNVDNDPVACGAQQRDKSADRRERPAHIGGQHRID